MRHDEAFKALVRLAPTEFLGAFLPEILVSEGPPVTFEIESVEVLPVLPGIERSRFFDVAIRYFWADGRQRILLLTEHWSRGREVVPERVAHYTTALMLRHPGMVVVPVLVIADSAEVSPVLETRLGESVVFQLTFRVLSLPRDLLLRWHQTHNAVLAILAALLKDRDPPQRAHRAVGLLLASPQGRQMLPDALPLLENLASLTSSGIPIFHRLLHEDPTMVSVIDLFIAEGKAEGEAKGVVNTLRNLVHRGLFSVDQAKAQVTSMEEQGILTASQAEQARNMLG